MKWTKSRGKVPRCGAEKGKALWLLNLKDQNSPDEARPAGRLAKLRGHAGKGLDTDAIMALTRGEPAADFHARLLAEYSTDIDLEVVIKDGR